MHEWEFSNLVETNVRAVEPRDWPDKPEAKCAPPGWLLIVDAECDVVAMAPAEIARMLERLLNGIEETNTWKELP